MFDLNTIVAMNNREAARQRAIREADEKFAKEQQEQQKPVESVVPERKAG